MFGKAIRFVRGLVRGKESNPPNHEALIPRKPGVQVVVPIGDAWVSAASVAPAQLLDHYLDWQTSDADVLAAAIWVHADDQAWNRPEDSEDFFHIQFWLSAMTALLEGESSQDIWAWEESGMQAVRRGDLVILEERTHHVQARLPPVCFELQHFARKLAEASRGAVDLLSGMKKVADERRPMLDEAMSARFQPSALPTSAEVRANRIKRVLEYLPGDELAAARKKLAAKVGMT
jgi:hypothetical protein